MSQFNMQSPLSSYKSVKMRVQSKSDQMPNVWRRARRSHEMILYVLQICKSQNLITRKFRHLIHSHLYSWLTSKIRILIIDLTCQSQETLTVTSTVWGCKTRVPLQTTNLSLYMVLHHPLPLLFELLLQFIGQEAIQWQLAVSWDGQLPRLAISTSSAHFQNEFTSRTASCNKVYER